MPVARAKIFCSMLKKGLNGSLKRLCGILQDVYVLLQMGGMLLGLLGHVPSNKQNNGRSATCGHTNFGFAEFLRSDA